MGIHFDRAQALFNLRRYKDAAREYLEELAENPNSYVATAGLAAARLNDGDNAGAEETIRHAITMAPDYAYSFYILSFVEERKSRLFMAYDAIREALRLAPSDADYFYQLARIYHLQNDLPNALSATEKAMEFDPHHVAAILLRGKILQQTGEIDEAKKLYLLALQADPERADAHYSLGKLELQHNHNANAALQMLTEARRLDPISKNDPATIAEAYGLMMRPFVWLNRFVPRWFDWPHHKRWIVSNLLALVALLDVMAFGVAFDDKKVVGGWAVVKMLLLFLYVIVGNSVVLSTTFNGLAANTALIVARRKIGATWGCFFDAFFQLFKAGLVHLLFSLFFGMFWAYPLAAVFAFMLGAVCPILVAINRLNVEGLRALRGVFVVAIILGIGMGGASLLGFVDDYSRYYLSFPCLFLYVVCSYYSDRVAQKMLRM